jgi:hypothetical protein
MIRKLLTGICAFFAIVAAAHADTYTNRLGLDQPSCNSMNWCNSINNNWAILDSTVQTIPNTLIGINASGYGLMYGSVTLLGVGPVTFSESGSTITLTDSVLSSTNNWTAQQTFKNTVFISSTVSMNGSTGLAGNMFISDGSGFIPEWSSLNLAGGANYVQGILPASNLPATVAYYNSTGPFTANQTFNDFAVFSTSASIMYNLNIGSMTGSGLTNCNSSGDYLEYASSNGQFGCSTTYPAASIAAGSLGPSVIASSVGVSGSGANTYGSAVVVPVITFGVDGRLTSVSSATITASNPLVATNTWTADQIFNNYVAHTSSVTFSSNVYMTNGGTVTLSGALSMGSNKINNLANGSASSDAAAFGQITAANAGALPTTGGTMTGNISFSPTSTYGIVGSTTSDKAATGNVGEWQQQAQSGVNLGTSNQFANIASISISSGDWDVSGVVVLNLTTEVITGNCAVALSAFSNNTTTDHVMGDNQVYSGVTSSTSAQYSTWSIPSWRVSVASNTTIYLKGLATFTGAGTGGWYGRISARRMR